MRLAGMSGDSNASTQALKPAMKITLQRAPEIPKRGPCGIWFRDLWKSTQSKEMRKVTRSDQLSSQVAKLHTKNEKAVTRLTHEEASACAALRCPSEASRRFPFAAQEAIDRIRRCMVSGCAVALVVPCRRVVLLLQNLSGTAVRHHDAILDRLSATPLCLPPTCER